MKNDLHFALRTLLRSPGITTAVALCLGLGIGATTAVFSVVNTVVLQPLPYADPERLVMVYEIHQGPDGEVEQYRVSPPSYAAWRQGNDAFAGLEAVGLRSVNLTGLDAPERLTGATASHGLFRLLGVKPLLGRTFTPEEDRAGAAAPVAVISHALWQRRFGGEPGVLGRKLLLDDQPHTVIGVMPKGFRFPEGLDDVEARELWMPLGLDVDKMPERRWRNLFVVGRLAPGSTQESAGERMSAIAARLEEELPDTHAGWAAKVVPLHDEVLGENVDKALNILLAAVTFVLLIACGNVASLLLARAGRREPEMALRMSLGAKWGQIVRQLLLESLLLALLGGAIGVLLAAVCVPPLLALSGLDLLESQAAVLDLRVLGFALVLSLATGLLFGLAPALRLASPRSLSGFLQQGGIRASEGAWGRRVQAVVAVAEIALVLVLLVGAGLTLRSFRALRNIDPGFETKGLLTLRILLAPTRYIDTAQKISFVERALERIRAVRGVESAGFATVLPIGDPEVTAAISVEGRVPEQPGEELLVNHRMIGAGYFETLGLQLLEGRAIAASDHAEAPGVVVVSREMAKRFWPGRSALGLRVKRGSPDSEEPWLTVVGVVEDVRDSGLDAAPSATWYLPFQQHEIRGFRIVVRTASEPLEHVSAVRSAIWSVDRDQPVFEIATVEELVSGSVQRQRFSTLLLGIFASVGLVLAALGIYGVMAYTVAQRTREIGIRMAMGAQAGQVQGMLLRDGAMLTAAGLVLGLAGSLALTRLLSAFLFRVDPADPMILALTTTLLAATALLAVWVPARRATKVDPLEILRSA